MTTILCLFQEQNYERLARAVQDRWGISPSPTDLACLRKLVFETDPPVAGGTDEQPWGDATWLLWIRNRLEDLSTQSTEDLAKRFDWSVPPSPKTVDDWRDFLQRFNTDLLVAEDVRETLDEKAMSNGWLGASPATDTQVMELEHRIGKSLPGSYRSFLLASNGWHTTGWYSIRLLSCAEVAWLRDADPGCFAGWCEGAGDCHVPDDEYFVYGETQDCGSIRNEYMTDMLLISDSGWAHQDYFFLNPRIILEDGEWEAWHFSPDFPGATRYQSFGLLMCAEYSELKRGLW